jgi:hypothetical protein
VCEAQVQFGVAQVESGPFLVGQLAEKGVLSGHLFVFQSCHGSPKFFETLLG